MRICPFSLLSSGLLTTLALCAACGGSSASGGDNGGDSETGTGSEGDLCASRGLAADTPLLLVRTGDLDWSILTAGGSTIALDAMPADPPAGTPSVGAMIEGDRVATFASWETEGIFVAIHDLSGERLWDVMIDGRGRAMLGTQERVAIDHYTAAGSLVTKDEVRSLADAHPFGPPLGDLMPASDSAGIGWLDWESEEMTNADLSFDSWGVFEESRWVYLHDDDGTPSMVGFTDDAQTQIVGMPTLEDVGDLFNVELLGHQAPGQVLIGVHGDDQHFVGVDLDAGTATDHQPTYPDGESPIFATNCASPTLDHDGSILMSLYDDSRAQAFDWEPSSDTWTPIGQGVTDILDLQARAYSGTYIVQSYVSGEDANCTPGGWAKNPDALSGKTSQAIRPESDVSLVLEDLVDFGAISVSQDGLCVARATSTDELEILDMETGEATRLDIQPTQMVFAD